MKKKSVHETQFYINHTSNFRDLVTLGSKITDSFLNIYQNIGIKFILFI